MDQDQKCLTSFSFDFNNVKEGKLENIKKVKSWGRVNFSGGGDSFKKMTAIRGGGHVKKLVSRGGVMQFLNGASQIPTSPPPS